MTLMLALLLALASTPECSPTPPSAWENPPAWPSFIFQQMDDEALRQLTLTRNGVPVVDLPEGVIVLGWLGTTMPGQAIHEWVYTREDRSVSSRLLHGDALERLYAAVVLWLKEHPRPRPLPADVPRERVSR